MKKGQSPKKCCHCAARSIPGLKKSVGLCAYHYAARTWGNKWASKLYRRPTSRENISLDCDKV